MNRQLVSPVLVGARVASRAAGAGSTTMACDNWITSAVETSHPTVNDRGCPWMADR